MLNICRLGSIVVASLAVVMIVASPASAQALSARTFVSGAGTDTGSCGRLAPCRSFAYAVTQTAAGGEITVLDSAGYGPVTITQSLTITNPGGVEAGVTASRGSSAITIDAAANAIVTLRGLTLEGGGTGTNGISVVSSLPFGSVDTVDILDCVIKDFTGTGINIAPVLSGLPGYHVASFYAVISNTQVLNNTTYGIAIAPDNTNLLFAIYQTIASGNGIGIYFGEANPLANAAGAITASHIDLSSENGIVLTGANSLMLKNSTVVSSGSLDISNAGSLNLYNNNMIGALNTSNGGTAVSDGTNDISSVTGFLTKTLPQ